jgi:adenylate kinase
MVSKILIVMGLSGAGKTTMLDNVKMRQSKFDYTVVNVGSMMKDMAIKRNIIINRDEIKKLEGSTMNKLRKDAYYRISGMDTNIVLDTHVTIENEEKSRIIPGIPFHSLLHLKNIAGLVYVNSPTEQVLKRRANDKKRKREVQDGSTLDNQRISDISILSYYSAYLNISLYIIENRDGKKNLNDAINKLHNAINEVFGN